MIHIKLVVYRLTLSFPIPLFLRILLLAEIGTGTGTLFQNGFEPLIPEEW